MAQQQKKVIAPAQARERMAEAIRDARRKFNAQNTAGLSFENEARFALQAISNNKQLLESAPETAKDALVDVAAAGLTLNPANQYAALQSRWNARLRRTEVTFAPMYRGLVKLATDTGVITNCRADIVFQCEEDSFDCDLGDKPFLKHKPKLFAPKEDRVVDLLSAEKNRMIGAYCIAYIKGSQYPHITVMDIGEIVTIARSSDAFQPRVGSDRKPSGPWVIFPGEMTKKAVIKRSHKQWPVSDGEAAQRLRNAIAIDDRNEVNEQASEVSEDELRNDMGEKLSKVQVERIRDLCQTQDLPTSTVSEAYGTNGLGKIPAKFFDEIEEKLLIRQRKFNEAKAAQEKQSTQGGEKGGKESKDAVTDDKPPAKERRGKTTGKGRKG